MRQIHEYIAAINEARQLANENKPEDLSDLLIKLPGMSSRKGRLFFNHLFRLLGEVNYLEIGVWMGSMFCSALHKNLGIKGFAIDNFSQFVQGPGQPHPVRETLYGNLAIYAPHGTFFEADCWSFDKSILPPIDVYFFDGNHDYQNQYHAWIQYDSVLADTFIAIVDDWEFEPHYYDVQLGTLQAFKDLKYKVVQSWFLQRADRWHEGMFVAVVQKRRSA